MVTHLSVSPKLPGCTAECLASRTLYGPPESLERFIQRVRKEYVCRIYSAEDISATQGYIALHFQLSYLFNLCFCCAYPAKAEYDVHLFVWVVLCFT